MINFRKNKINIPQNLKLLCQKYNNGSIIWMSGTNSTLVQYFDTTKNNQFDIIRKANKLNLTKTYLKKTQTFYNLYKKHQEKKFIRYFNLIHMQLQNAIVRATVGIKKYLFVRGVGYKFIKKNKYLMLQVGYSHKINILLPSYIKTTLNRKSTKIKCIGTDVEFMTGLLASIRSFKKPDVYKGKGIRYRKDNVIRKEGKKKKSF